MAGIIAEYDPLHNGHAWHIAQARAASGDEPTVVVMSCCFTQRGMPALLSPHARAEMALRAGADIVLGLPVSFSVCEAARFALGGVSREDLSKIIIAYEPVWAIGTGKTATAEQAQEIHAFIRSLIADKYGKEVADNTSILYGGSCKPSNAKELFANPDVDGGLIGGAALKVVDFKGIIDAFK